MGQSKTATERHFKHRPTWTGREVERLPAFKQDYGRRFTEGKVKQRARQPYKTLTALRQATFFSVVVALVLTFECFFFVVNRALPVASASAFGRPAASCDLLAAQRATGASSGAYKGVADVASRC